MSMLEDVFEHSWPGIVIGAVASAVLIPLVGGRYAAHAGANGAASRGRGRPLMKAAVRGYLAVADRIKEKTTEAREQWNDVVAEVREERMAQAEAPESTPHPEGTQQQRPNPGT